MSYDFTSDFINEAKPALNRPGGSVELPFGEKTVVVDTLTWDGNTDGLTTFIRLCMHNIAPDIVKCNITLSLFWSLA